jgi:hypothetical protein
LSFFKFVIKIMDIVKKKFSKSMHYTVRKEKNPNWSSDDGSEDEDLSFDEEHSHLLKQKLLHKRQCERFNERYRNMISRKGKKNNMVKHDLFLQERNEK